uniref:Uncharacterized protein LOC103329902 n=1 Tax=Rhizophora mucronata TaxID=61149 RepID=A0A2P2MVI4_RHIMU
MHGAMQSGGHSPKPLNGPTSATQLKPNSDSAQNSSSFSSLGKGKKRERSDQVSDPGKRECLSKPEDGDLGQSKGGEHVLKSEIANITDKGGLVDFEGVEKLVQLMQPYSTERRVDLVGRIMLVDVIAATDRLDCLVWFVQLKGLPVLDEWLQEVHKGKFGDGNSPKESEKGVEEFLLALLRALGKLPVNLPALQTCNVGRSVNHLRTHKNYEIQKKARSLVDTWKKRVEAEMNMNDSKSGLAHGVSWPAKSAPSEVSHVGNRKSGGPVETGLKSSVTQSSIPKSSQVKLATGEGVAKSSVLPGTMKSVTVSAGGNSRDANSKMLTGSGTSDPPLTMIKEERSSSSSQSQNNSQSCSSDHAKPTGSSYREDARNLSAGSATVSRGSSFRHRKSSNGVHASAASGFLKEPGSGNDNSGNKNSTVEKASLTGVSHDKTSDVSLVDHGNNQRLIVRLPNTSRSPTRGANGGSLEDIAATSRASSPGEKPDNYDRGMRGRSEVSHPDAGLNVNSDLCQEKDGLCGADKAKGITACDEQLKIGEDGIKVMEESKATSSLLGVTPRTGAPYDASLSSINALVESCAKFSEASASASPEDDVGMNLLASVAAGEILKADNVSPLNSPQTNSPVEEQSSSGNDVKLLRPLGKLVDQSEPRPSDMGGADPFAKKHVSVDSLQGKNEGRYPPLLNLINTSVDGKVAFDAYLDRKGENNVVLNSLHQTAEVPHLRSDVKPAGVTQDPCVVALSNLAKTDSCTEVEGVDLSYGHRKSGAQRDWTSGNSDSKSRGKTPAFHDDKRVDGGVEGMEDNNMVAESELAAKSVKSDKDVDEKPTCSTLEIKCPKQHTVDKESISGVLTEEMLSPKVEVDQESLDRKNGDASLPSVSENVQPAEPNAEVLPDAKAGDHSKPNERPTDLVSSVSDHDIRCTKENPERKEALSVSDSHMEPPPIAVQVSEPCDKSCGSKLYRAELQPVEEQHTSCSNDSVSVAGSGVNVKLDFDLNEGFPMDDGNQVEPTKSLVSGSSVHLTCPSPIAISSVSGSFSGSITVAAAAKGSFVLPENPLQTKGVLGWKGSAATSAFRPAEPRKNLDMLLSTDETSTVDTAGKQGRPLLDIDLNVPDDRVLEDVTVQSSSQASCSKIGSRVSSTGGLDLDLNRVDESPDTGLLSGNTSRLETPAMPNRLSLPCGLSNGVLNASRGFDLNNGPSLDEVASETAVHSQSIRTSLPFPSIVPAVRVSGAEFGNLSSWFPTANSYSALTVPTNLPGRGEQSFVAAAGSQRILAPLGNSSSFGPEMYRPVLSSSPAVPFPAATPFQYPGFPFETRFPVSSTTFSGSSTTYMESEPGGPRCFPTVPSQIVGPAGVVSSSYPRPYMMSLPGHSSISTDNRKWGGQLDLNAGPGGSDTEWRDERLPSTMRPHSFSSPQILAEENRGMYHQMAGGLGSSIFKQKGPDGSWDPSDRLSSYKQSSWQ